MSESGPLSDGNAEPHREERDETRTALLEAVEEHETDEIPGGAQVGAVLTTANENLEYRLTFVFETLLQLMAEGALYESADGQLRPTDPQLVTDGGVDQSADGVDRVECTNCGSVEKYTLPDDGEIRDSCRECGADALEVLDDAE